MNWRIRVTFILLIGIYGILLLRLFYWQVVKAEELSHVGRSQYDQQITLLPKRGEIKTSDNFAIAANKLSYLVFANPKQITEKEKTIELLSSKLQIDKATISALLSLDKFWVPLKSKVDNSTKEEVENFNLSGIGFEEQSLRFYPEASLAAQLIGFVAKDEEGQDKGYFGVEGYYDRQLKGKPGIGIQIKDALGRPILAKVNENLGQIDGRTLILDIDRTIQFLVERKLKDGIDTFGASSGMVAVMNPKNGALLAMASFPSFDQRHYADYQENLYKNPFISNVYEPGSTFKSLIMAAALDANAVKPDTKCDSCEGPVQIAGYSISTWNNKYHKDITMTETIQHSDNTGMVFAVRKLGLDKTLSYLEEFGIGQTTGIDLQGEIAPNLRALESWSVLDLATTSFGQGINITPIELLDAFSAIANNGKRMEPHIVSQIATSQGDTLNVPPKILSTPISEKTAKVMTELLVNAVDNGEAKWAKPKGYRIAGKTGTAQIPIAGHYDPNKTIASFIGFAPADDPKFSMLVIIDRPTTSIYGAETAAPLFFDIAKDLFAYYKIVPSE